MIVAGVDVGSKNIQIVLLVDGAIAAKVAVASGFEPEQAARQGLADAGNEVGISIADIGYIVSTGVGRKGMPFVQHQVTEVAADARGAYALRPSTRTVIAV